MAEDADTLLEDLFADTEAEESENAEDSGSDEDTQEDKAEGWEKRYKDLQSTYTKDREELLRLKKAFVGEEDSSGPADYFDDKELEAKVKEDPSSVLQIMRQMRDETVDVLRAQRKEIEREIAKTDPEQAALLEVVEELKLDEDYASFTDDQLLVIAQKVAVENAAPKIKKAYNPSGTRKGGGKKKEQDVTKTALWRAIYKDTLDEVE